MDSKSAWHSYMDAELARTLPILKRLGYTLDADQPHTKGERFLFKAVTTASGKKLILLGKNATGKRVVIKATSDPKGKEEIRDERRARAALGELSFAYHRFYSPEELAYIEEGGLTISIQAFVEHEGPFLERPLVEQFNLALKGFKVQEGAHATTYAHLRSVGKIFEIKRAGAYLSAAHTFAHNIILHTADRSRDALIQQAESFVTSNAARIEQYCGFLTHVDFVPHNIRVVNGEIYLLDHSSLTFGNKYEGWARFINFMTLYNPPLANALTDYVRINRTPEESEALKIMRVYRLLEIIWNYVQNVSRSTDNLRALSSARVDFWTAVLAATLSDTPLPDATRNNYIALRDSLRSVDEKERQIGLH